MERWCEEERRERSRPIGSAVERFGTPLVRRSHWAALEKNHARRSKFHMYGLAVYQTGGLVALSGKNEHLLFHRVFG
jgi:hypothetical protein